MRKWWRLPRKGWVAPVAIVVAVGIIVALAFYVRGFQGTSNDPIALPPSPGASLGSPSPSKPHAKHPHKKGHGKQVVVPGGGPTLTLGSGGGSGLSFSGGHTMVVHVESAEPIGVIGYLSPTSPDLSYGTAKNVGRSWTVRTTVAGPPKYAIIWIYGAKDGTPVSCSITLDGKVADRETTKGPYGRQICFA
jgi:hypothetical protein